MLYFIFLFIMVVVALVVATRSLFISGAVAFVFFAISAIWSITLIDNSEVGVIKIFGETEESELAPGVHAVAPWKNVISYTALPRTFDYEGEVMSSDSNPLHVTVGFTVKLNPAMAWKVQKVIGQDYFTNIVVPAGQTATRRGIALFAWQRAATSDRHAVETAILEEFRKVLNEQFSNAGFSAEETALAMTLFPVQLRKSLPDQKVLNAVAEKTAAEQDLERQVTLTKIAGKEAERREQEGLGVQKLFDNLPSGFTAAEISDVLGALANKTRADAMLKAVESGQVDTIIMNGDTAGGVANSFGGKTVLAPQGN